jgi:hypothetical protein
MTAKKTTKTNAKTAPKQKTAAPAKVKKLSALDAAAKVLVEAGHAMNSKEMIEAMTIKGYWKSPAGRTPHATLYAAILREQTTKGTASRFKKTEPGKFAATKAAQTDETAPTAPSKPKAGKAKPAKAKGVKAAEATPAPAAPTAVA